jgi:hypothetical protein
MTITETAPPLAAFLRPELPPAALRGLAGDVATALSESAGTDPAAVLVSFLTLLGNAAGPQPHARFGGADHPARLFAVLVGDAATARKGTALGAVERLFEEADPDWADSRVLYGLQSAEAMIDHVADGSGDCRLMVVETEFGRLVETMARAGTLSAQLRNAWDGRALQRSTVKFTRRATRAHISLLAMITPEELLRHHDRLSQAGGLESRILYVYAAPAQDVSPFAAGGDHPDLAARVRDALLVSRQRVMGSTDPVGRYLLTLRGIQPRTEFPVSDRVARSWGAKVRARLPIPGDGLRSLHSRAEPQVIRLAACYALAGMAGEISQGHVDAALALLSYCARSAEIVFGVPVARLRPRADPRHAAAVVRYLHEIWPARATPEQIAGGGLKGRVTAADVAAALASLLDKRLAEQRRGEYRLAAPQLPFPAITEEAQ